jgi:uncharacterized protein (TIGR02646 family)
VIRLPDVPLPEAARLQLTEYQQELDVLPDYAERVARAQERFKSLNQKGNPTFDSIKATLTRMCSGARRCAYCEDSAADEVEHIRPKTLYPELTFAWMNYLYACGPCNGPKNNRFAVFTKNSSVPTNVSRRKNAPVVPPIPGEPVLLDPRVEDPTEYMSLDLRDTFWFVARAKPGTREYQRAKYTIDTLQLNARDVLPQARRSAYLDYRAHLRQYIQERDAGGSQVHLAQLIREIQTRQHATVWLEMKRQHLLVPELKQLFDAAPEALGW